MSLTTGDIALLVGIALFVYPFVLYPALLAVAGRRRAKRQDGAPQPNDELPPVALVICALNEQRVIRQKLENSLQLDYPAGKLKIVVVSDGSTDATAGIVREYMAAGVELIDRPVRRGKIANLNEVLPGRPEEILVLSDANVMYRSDAVRRLALRFRDPRVGCVSGKVILTETTGDLAVATDTYYSLEWLLQETASALYSMVGADGAMYALRRELFRKCPNDTVIEDLVIPMSVVRQGKRVVFEGAAIGWERGVSSVREEFRRKIRIAAGAMQGLLRGNVWPRNAPPRFWFIFISHKLLRWLSPAIALLVVAIACVSLDRPLSMGVLAVAGAVHLIAGLRLVTGHSSRLMDAAFYFIFGQIAIALGLIKGITGQQSVLWAKADR